MIRSPIVTCLYLFWWFRVVSETPVSRGSHTTEDPSSMLTGRSWDLTNGMWAFHICKLLVDEKIVNFGWQRLLDYTKPQYPTFNRRLTGENTTLIAKAQ